LSAMADLTHLKTLQLQNNQISDISPLSALSNLQLLYLHVNQISDINPLSTLTNLEKLSLFSNQISDISPLSDLVNLRLLYLIINQISNLYPLVHLPNLKELTLNHNQISNLRPILPLIKQGISIHLEYNARDKSITVGENPLDPSLIAAIDKGNQAVIDYYDALSQAEEVHIHEAKLMIVGEPRAGKTSLRLKLKDINAALPQEIDSTKGVYIEQEHVTFTTLDPTTQQPVPFQYHIWDFGGQTEYKPISQLFVTRSALYIAVINTDLNDNDKDLMYWFETLEKLSEGSPVLVVENTPTDRLQSKNLQSIKGRFADMWRGLHIINLDKLIDGSPRHDPEQVKLFETLRKDIHGNLEQLPHRRDKMPKSWAAIRRAITAQANAKQADGSLPTTMPYARFEAICADNLITDPDKQAQLAGVLHILGVFQHYKDNPVLNQTIILNNKWATDAAYKVLDDTTVKGNEGTFDRTDITSIWSDAAYRGRQQLLVALMQEFRLCYNIDRTTTYVVPHCLPHYDSYAADWDNRNNVRLKVQYDYLPLATIVQLLVGLHHLIDKGQRWIWQSGGVIHNDKPQGLRTWAHIEQSADKKQLMIRVRGNMTRELMEIVLMELASVNRPFPNLVIKKSIACNCPDCINSPDPTYFDYEKDLLRHLYEKRKSQIYCNNLAEFVSIDQLLSGFVSKEQVERDNQVRNYQQQVFHIQGDFVNRDKAGGDKVEGDKNGG
jgi:internalin A